ncbi:MAG: potassium channel family protein [Pseudomonadota bacterium]
MSHRLQRVARKRFITRRGLLYSLALCLLILGMGGVGFWVLEPRALTLSDGLWLAFTTAATVGYGDIVPSTHASRAFAVLVVLLGLAVLSLVTASMAAMFVETEERQIERDLMHAISALRTEVMELHAELRDLRDNGVVSPRLPGADGKPRAGTPGSAKV